MVGSTTGTVEEAMRTAVSHHRRFELPQAETLYRQVLSHEPEHADALHLLGVIALQVGNYAVAVELIGTAIDRNGAVPDYHNNLATALGKQGRLDEAIARCREALRLMPGFAEAHNNLSAALRELGHLDDAIASGREALRLRPEYAEAHYNLGTALQQAGDLDAALTCYREALRLRPGYADAHNNLGLALQECGHLDDAVAQYKEALRLQPDDAQIHNNLGAAHQAQGDVAAAIARYEAALRLQTDHPQALSNLTLLRQHLCDWTDLEEHWSRLKRIVRTTPAAPVAPLTFMTLPSTGAEQLRCARQWVAQRYAPRAQLRAGLGFHFTRFTRPRPGGARLRVGYVSADWGQHPVGELLAGLLERHERARVEVVGYALRPSDGSALRARLEQGCDRFVELAGHSDVAAARRIYGDGIDVLVNLNGHTSGARTGLFALRPAPVQVSYLGYCGSMGADFMDWVLLDEFVAPVGAEAAYSERLLRLAGSVLVGDRTRPLGPRPGRAACGLPQEGMVYACFNGAYKITPAVYDAWMRVLGAVAGSVLWLGALGEAAAGNLRREAGARGIDPARVLFAAREGAGAAHLGRLGEADLFLDTQPYSAHATAVEALLAGVPVLTCAGATWVSRMAGSVVRAAGLPELVMPTLAAYEARAVALGRDRGQLAAVRARLAAQQAVAPLFDVEGYVRRVEEAYARMWAAHLAAPEHPA